MKNKIFINLSEIASEVITFIKTRPQIFRKKNPDDIENSPAIKHTVKISNIKSPIKKINLSNNF